MMRHGLSLLGVSPEECAIIGDRMDTDIVAGVECGIDTVLVLSGVTTEHEMRKFPYRPRYVLSGVGDIAPKSAPAKKKPKCPSAPRSGCRRKICLQKKGARS